MFDGCLNGIPEWDTTLLLKASISELHLYHQLMSTAPAVMDAHYTHYVGTIETAGAHSVSDRRASNLNYPTDFANSTKTLQLRWFIEHSHDWRILEGVRQGHSQCYAHERAGSLAIFDHPVDVLLRVSSVKPGAIDVLTET